MRLLRSPYHYYLGHLGLEGDGGDNDTIPGDCSLVKEYNWTDRCYFVEHNANCQEVEGFLNYVSLLYCTFQQALFPLAVTLYTVWLVVLFMALAVAADEYFCPATDVIARTCRMSQNMAGVTIMAFGNGAPDIFSSLAGVTADRPELVFGALFGAGVFVTTVVAGSVAITRPFKVMERPLLRDIVFYLSAGFWAFYVFWKQEIHLYDSLGFLGLYVAYILVVLVGRYIHTKTRTSQPYSPQVDEVDTGREAAPPPARHLVAVTGDPPEVRLLPENLAASTWRSNLNVLARAINPMPPREEWRELNWFWKVLAILKAPLRVVFCLTIPRMMYEMPMRNWCQYLTLIQCTLSPLFVVFATSVALDPVGGSGIQVYQLVLLASAILAPLVALTSRSGQPPVYQPLLGFVGFGVSIVWIYIIANELVSLLKAFGVVFGLTDGILGLTALAWGNSIGDLIADTAMAHRGQPRTGFSACFGGQLFNLLLGVGLPFSIALLANGSQPIPLHFNRITLTLSVGLGASLLFSFVALPLLRFHASRLYGAALIAIYVVFLTGALVVEFKLM